MRYLRKVGTFGLQFTLALVSLSFGSTVARADSVTYTFTGTGLFAGTTFSFTSASGFISSPTGILIADPGGVIDSPFFLPFAPEPLTSFSIGPDPSIPSLELLTIDPLGPFGNFIPILPLNLSSFGTEQVNSPSNQINGVFGTFVIAPTPAPESSSLSLLLSGLLGLGLLSAMARLRKALGRTAHID